MPTYKINSTGARIIADQAFMQAKYPGNFALESDAPAGPASRRMTKLEYMNRFTNTELATIYTAAKTVVSVEIWLEKFKLAEYIDQADPETAAGLAAMEAAGLIGSGRSAQILS